MSCQLPVAGSLSSVVGARRRAFTLTELMISIAIIAILIAILVPAVSKVRTRAQAAATAAQIAALQSAIEAYNQTFRAYPGPLSNDDIIRGVSIQNVNGTITMSENLVLGLLGGLRGTGNVFFFDDARNAVGPMSLNPNSPKRYPAFYSQSAGQLYTANTNFKDASGMSAKDSNIPEFLDRFTADPLPLLYLRARVGAPDVISDGEQPQKQYDVRQYRGYVGDSASSPLVLGGKMQGSGSTGLYNRGAPNAPFNPKGPNNAYPYFRNPSLSAGGTPTPYGKDAFILISAGPDRIYGTSDDITTFGNPGQ